MIRSQIIKLLVVLFCLAAGLAVGIGYGQMKLSGQEKLYQAKIKEINQRLAYAQRRSSEEKARQTDRENEKLEVLSKVENLEKAKGILSAENRDLKSKVTAQENKTAVYEAKISALTALEKKIPLLEGKEAALEAKAAALEAKNAELTEHLSRAQRERNSLNQKMRETAAGLKNSEKDLARVRTERARLEADLKTMNQRFSQCEVSNGRLYAIAEDLIQQYKNKGIMDALGAKEPLTQIRRVELDRLGNEYRDKIDKEKTKKP